MPGLSGSLLDMFPPSLASLNATYYVIHPSAWKANPVPYNMGWRTTWEDGSVL